MLLDHLPNVFKNFDNLYKIDAAQIQSHLNFTLPPVVIENYVANRLLFPYAIPTTPREAQLELAVLASIVTLNSGFFYNQTLQKITIPPEYSLVYQDINKLVETVVANVALSAQASIIIPNLTGHNTMGTAIAVANATTTEVIYDNQKFALQPGKILHIAPKSANTITINGSVQTITPRELGIYIVPTK